MTIIATTAQYGNDLRIGVSNAGLSCSDDGMDLSCYKAP